LENMCLFNPRYVKLMEQRGQSTFSGILLLVMGYKL
jgi:hypothetical protein